MDEDEEWTGQWEDEPGWVELTWLFITDNVMYNFLRQRTNLRMQCHDLCKQYNSLMQTFKQKRDEVDPMQKNLEKRVEYLRNVLDKRGAERGQTEWTEAELATFLTPAEHHETEQLELLRSTIEDKEKNLVFLRQVITEVNLERKKRHQYLESIAIANTIQEINSVMESMRGYDLTVSAERIINQVEEFTKQSMSLKNIDVQQRRVEATKTVAIKIGERVHKTKNILDLIFQPVATDGEPVYHTLPARATTEPETN